MPVIRQYYQTASERQLLTVTYTCKHCGHQNIDNDQAFLFSGASRTSVNPNRKAAGAEAEASMDRNKQRILDQIYDDKYRNAGLHCRCENCGKKPLWSTYINTSWLLVIAIVGLCEATTAQLVNAGIAAVYETNALHRPFSEVKARAKEDFCAAAKLLWQAEGKNGAE